MNSISLLPPPQDPFDFSRFFSAEKSERSKFRIREDRHQYKITLKIPGFIIDDIHIHFRAEALHIFANSCRPRFKAQKQAHFSLEQHKFQKHIPIPEDILEDQISYLYEEEVLTVLVPKKKQLSSTSFFLEKFRLFKK